MTTERNINALVPYFGAKRNLAARIITELGKHSAYWEPFCGSMAVLLSKGEASHETVNDLHGDLINLARVIQHPTMGPQLYRRLRRVLMAEDMYREAIDQIRRSHAASEQADVDRAFAYFLVSWIGRNGIAGTDMVNKTFAVRWSPGGGAGGTRFKSAVASIPQWRRRIRRVTILKRNAFDVIESISDEHGVAIYLDPPYLKSSRSSGRYLHDFQDGGFGTFAVGDDHHRLADLARRFVKARVVISYYDDPRLLDLYPASHWNHQHIVVNKTTSIGNTRGEKPNKATEVLIINGPSYADQHDQEA